MVIVVPVVLDGGTSVRSGAKKIRRKKGLAQNRMESYKRRMVVYFGRILIKTLAVIQDIDAKITVLIFIHTALRSMRGLLSGF